MSSEPAHPERDHEWNQAARNETQAERLDRNWNDLLQELRVIQTGVQLLTGFLLTLPFQQQFSELTSTERGIYLSTVVASIIATVFLQAPVGVHRALFRQHERERTVLIAHRLAMIGMVFLAVAIVGVTLIVFSVLHGMTIAVGAGIIAALLICSLWWVLPRVVRRGEARAEQNQAADR
jgi:O-antigen/teichoic acid export membrane protein